MGPMDPTKIILTTRQYSVLYKFRRRKNNNLMIFLDHESCHGDNISISHKDFKTKTAQRNFYES